MTNIIISSYPKCGTHLLSDILSKITKKKLYSENELNIRDRNFILNAPKKAIITGHNLNTISSYFDTVKKLDYKLFINYRDPRDQIVSYYHFIMRNMEYMQFPGVRAYFCAADGTILPKNKVLENLICGVYLPATGERRNGYPLRMLCWFTNYINNCINNDIEPLISTFEEIITDKPIYINRVLNFLKLDLTTKELDEIINKTSFSHKSSYDKIKRQGRHNNWRKHLTTRHIKLFKEFNSQILITLGYEKSLNWQ